MPRLSIVIPCLGGGVEFDGTLVSVLQHRPANCEVLVVHTEPYADPYDLAGEVTFLLAEGQSLPELINAGLAQAQGDVLHVLHCGIAATEGWTDAALAHFDDPQVASVSPVVLSADAQSLLSAGIRWTLGGARRIVRDRRLLLPGTARLRASILGPRLTAGFYRREVLVGLGGLDVRSDGHADVELAVAIDELGFLQTCEPASRLIQTEELQALPNNAFRTGRAAERLFWLRARANGLALSLTMHPLAVAPAFGNLATLLGRAVALLDLNAPKRHSERLQAAKAHLAELAAEGATIRLPAKKPPAAQLEQRRRAA